MIPRVSLFSRAAMCLIVYKEVYKHPNELHDGGNKNEE